jgi:hypothetical protein
MHNTLGIVIPHLGAGQKTYEAIKLINSVGDGVIFFEQLVAPCVEVKCATMCVNELMNFSGTLVTTDLEGTQLAHNVVNINKTKTIFYVWDLEWLRLNRQNYLTNWPIYHMPDVLVARSKEHVGPIENYCRRTPIVRDFSKVLTC